MLQIIWKLAQFADTSGSAPAHNNHTCDVCARSFSYQSQLNSHMKTHSDERPFTCPGCRRGFKRPDHLSRHVNKCGLSSSPANS